MNKKEYFKIAKIWTSTLLFFLILFLAGCSLTNNIEKSYNLKEDIKGRELTFEDLKNERNKINLNKSLYPYGQIKAYGVSDLIDEIADNDNGSEELIIKYDFSSEKLEDIKIYVEAKTSLNSYQAFINDGFNYYNFKTNGKEHKGKKAILFSDYMLPYKEIFEKVIEVIELPILDGELNNQLLDLIKNYMKYEMTIDAVKDSKNNIVMTIENKNLKFRIVIKDGKVLYIAGRSDDVDYSLLISYDKPKFSYPNTNDYK